MKKVIKAKTTALIAIFTAMSLMTGCGNWRDYTILSAIDKLTGENQDDEDLADNDDDNDEEDEEIDEDNYDDSAAKHVDPGILATISNENRKSSEYEFWVYTDYVIYYDQHVEVTECHIEDGEEVIYFTDFKMKDTDFDPLKKNLKKVRPDNSYLDGDEDEAWSIQVYNEDGDLTNSMPMGFVVGERLIEDKIIEELYAYAKTSPDWRVISGPDNTGDDDDDDDENNDDDDEVVVQVNGIYDGTDGEIDPDNPNVYVSFTTSYKNEASTTPYGGVNHIYTIHHDGTVHAQVFYPDGTEDELDYELTDEQFRELHVYVSTILDNKIVEADLSAETFYQFDFIDTSGNILVSTIVDDSNTYAAELDAFLIDIYLVAWIESL